MPPTPVIIAAAASVCFFVLLQVLAPVARKFDLVDSADPRKQHAGTIPLIGGLATFLSLTACLLFWYELDRSLLSYICALSVLVVLGVIDDRLELSPKIRIFIEVMATNIMIFGAELWVSNLGDLFAFGELQMPFWVAFVFTQVAVFGIINALNMVDGIDGLAAGIALIAITILTLTTSNSVTLDRIDAPIIGCLIVFLLCNLGVFSLGPKVFLGDAGSMLLGFTLVWVLIETATTGNNESRGLMPATSLYFVALPLYDMVATTMRRVRSGVSPFQADRNHLHHLLLRAGIPVYGVLCILLLASLSLNLLGALLSAQRAPNHVQFGLFCLLYLVFSYATARIHRSIPDCSTPACAASGNLAPR